MPRFLNVRVTFSLLLPTLCAACVVGEQTEFSETNSVDLDVVVTGQSGAPVRGLKQQDFTVFDNGVPLDIASFEAIDGRLAAMEVVIVLDAVNTGEREVAIEREEINKFLRVDGGHLAHPTKVALLTDKGLQFQEGFSQDGNTISSALKHTKIPLRSIGRDADHGGEADRFQISFQAFAQLIAGERNRPGRKLIIWVSPGWPLLSRELHNVGRREQIFGNLVEISKQLQQGEITLDSIDPTSTGDIDPGLTDPPTVHLRPSNENATIEGARNPNDVQWRNLALDVTAVQSGGLALHPGNDIASELQKSIADRSAYYEISFNRVVTDRANEYHRLDVRIGKPTLTARTRQGYYSQRLRAGTSPVEFQHPANAPNDPSNEAYDVSSHSYIDQSLTELAKRIPELKTVRPAADQQKLYVILQKVGLRVDDFMRNIGDLIASEDIMQEKLNENGRVTAKERVQDNYLILHHGYEWGSNAEYRMDEKGNRLGPLGLEKGYLVTSGYALSCISFATVAQAQSRFLYLGDENVESRETYVLGFAQQPGQATFFTTMTGTGGPDVNMLTQGILWVDKNSFQIIRMHSDLLFPNEELRVDQLTTQINFGEVRLQDVPKPLWLPKEADVYIQIGNQSFRNTHHYTNYRRYRVSVNLGR